MALIEREAALNCAEYDEHYRLVIPVGKVKELITIDAAPVVYGRWIWNPEYCKWVYSECGGREGECEAPICKWCGARMDGGEGHGL